MGINSFMKLYHLAPIALNDETIVSLGIMSKSQLEKMKEDE